MHHPDQDCLRELLLLLSDLGPLARPDRNNMVDTWLPELLIAAQSHLVKKKSFRDIQSDIRRMFISVERLLRS